MKKKQYVKPEVKSHEMIIFETLLSCESPNEPATIDNGNIPICVMPGGGGWFPR